MRQYICEKKLDKKGLLVVDGKDYKYFKQVLRFVCGDMVHVRFFDGNLETMTVCKIDEKEKKIILQKCDVSVSDKK